MIYRDQLQSGFVGISEKNKTDAISTSSYGRQYRFLTRPRASNFPGPPPITAGMLRVPSRLTLPPSIAMICRAWPALMPSQIPVPCKIFSPVIADLPPSTAPFKDRPKIEKVYQWFLGESGKMSNLNGTSNADTIIGTSLDDKIYGLDGNDYIKGADGADYIDGGNGNDKLDGGPGNDHLVDLYGNNVFSGGDGNDLIEAGKGNDHILGDGGNDTIYGGDGRDYLDGGYGDDVIHAGPGDDGFVNEIDPATGLITTEAVAGGAGNDWIYGEDGNDKLKGQAGDDHVYGGTGNDLVDGGDGNNYLDGGTGNDILSSEGGKDQLYGGDGNDNLQAGAGDDYLDGGNDQDSMNGEDGNDIMFGGSGNDTMFGGNGNDQIHGDAGNDQIFGEAGHDQLWGGAGADWFVFKGAGALDGGDTIEDFEDGIDRIVLEKLGVTAYKVGGAAGTVYAHDLASGDVGIDVTTSTGVKFSIDVANPHHTLSAAKFSAADFVFA